ncbi:adult cuticle protein 1-like [Sabethes cyaneus]|uniref:adult cuticle protein 1-like n=1 Tax=Sabethes cyaneus TaxID=53552 RepID=UPI00237E063A|nr:adult cuticle protein 1-like [Sabethes cyaneus]
MKCIAATVMVAVLAVISEGSYAPAVYTGHHGYAVAPVVTYAAHHGGPTVVQSNDQHSWAYANAYNNHWGYGAPVAVAYNSWDGHYAPAVAYQGAHWNHWDGHVAAPVAIQHAASYVAANRGAVHKAPLVGHAVNQKSLNLAPAPGTW